MLNITPSTLASQSTATTTCFLALTQTTPWSATIIVRAWEARALPGSFMTVLEVRKPSTDVGFSRSLMELARQVLCLHMTPSLARSLLRVLLSIFQHDYVHFVFMGFWCLMKGRDAQCQTSRCIELESEHNVLVLQHTCVVGGTVE